MGCVWFIYRNLELRHWLVHGSAKQNKLVEWKEFVDTARIKSTDLKNKFLFLSFAAFLASLSRKPNYLVLIYIKFCQVLLTTVIPACVRVTERLESRNKVHRSFKNWSWSWSFTWSCLVPVFHSVSFFTDRQKKLETFRWNCMSHKRKLLVVLTQAHWLIATLIGATIELVRMPGCNIVERLLHEPGQTQTRSQSPGYPCTAEGRGHMLCFWSILLVNTPGQ